MKSRAPQGRTRAHGRAHHRSTNCAQPAPSHGAQPRPAATRGRPSSRNLARRSGEGGDVPCATICATHRHLPAAMRGQRAWSTTGDGIPSSACTRRPDEIGTDGFSSSRLAGKNSGGTWRRRRRQRFLEEGRGGGYKSLGLGFCVLVIKEHCDVLSMQMDSDLVIYRTTTVRTFQVITICRVDKSESTGCVLGKWVYLVTLSMSLFNLQDVCIVIGSLATLDLPMVVDLIGIYVLKGPYCTLTMIDWFLQALSVIPRGSWGDVARRFTMIRWASPKL
ncbi:sucrose synthase 7-like [Dorcoceras hygrometricum]|uniref:Sucrose synthase 7-like n=1 Tax=Dorcoceras hygrometricum TaxID=472368 RepID=A0A2Z7D2M5_9LAMI|nr:sucrose synthase 7-like [Dorcoceras hygrometricum]